MGWTFPTAAGVRVAAAASVRPGDLLGPAHRVDNARAAELLPGLAEALARRDLGTDHPWTAWGVASRDWACLPGSAPALDVCALATEAARRCDAGPVDVLILATSTPSRVTRSDAHAVASALGLTGAAWDVRAGGAAGLIALAQGAAAAAAGARVLVIAAEVISAYADPADPILALLYGDCAAAVVLEPGAGRLTTTTGHVTSAGTSFTVPDPLPPRPGATFRARRPDAAYQAALAAVWDDVADRLAGEVDVLLPYAVTAGQVARLAERVGAPAVSVLADHGCVGCASPLAALAAWDGTGRRLGLAAVGGGISWASALWEVA